MTVIGPFLWMLLGVCIHNAIIVVVGIAAWAHYDRKVEP